MKKTIFITGTILLLALAIYLLPSYVGEGTEGGNGSISVMVSILPQVDFVERIGGSRVEVSEMIPPGFSPATYSPSPDQLKKLQDADVYFRIGHISFEKAQMEKLADINPGMKIIDTSEGVQLLEMTAHEHGEENENGHEERGHDPHIWLSPKLVKIQAKHIYDALVEHSPENSDYLTQNYNNFIEGLEELDQKLEAAFAPINDGTILVYHPAFGYLADAYGFHQEAIEIEGKEPTPAQLQKIISEAKEDNIKIVFVQSQFSTKSAESVAEEIEGAVVQIDPLAKDYFANLEIMAETIVTSVK